MPLARIFRVGLACPSRQARKIREQLAAKPAVTLPRTPPGICRAIANTPASRRAAIRPQRELLRHRRQAEWKGAGIAWSTDALWPGRRRASLGIVHGLGATFGSADGTTNPYFASVARPGSLFTNSRNARAASLSFALFSMTTACSIAG